MRGFKAGQVSIEAELDNNNKHTVSDIYKSSKELDFLDFLMLLSEEAQLRRKMEVFKIEQSYRNPKFHTMRDNELSSLEDGIAGSFGGLLSTMIGHPFDTIKVRLQTSVNSQSAAATTLKLLRDEGPLAFFKGLSSPLSAIPVVNALVFASYEKSKHMFQSHYGIEDLSLAQLGVCGGAAGFANCIVIAPVELVRTRLQIQTIAVEGSQLTRFSPFFSKMLFDSGQSAGEPKPAHTMYGKAKYAGPIDCVRSIVTTQGVRGLFTGMFATAIRDVPGYMGQFFAYEKVKQLMLSKNGPPDQELSTPKLLFSGGCGGVFGWAITYPQDIVKSRLQVAKPGTFYRHRIIPDGGFLHCFRHTVKAEGYAGLFKGIGPCLIRAFPVNAASFYGYEWMSRLIKERRSIQ
jgi:solute carrier family 25 carnitine/acylcarnitine transporter 20/29